MSQVPNLRKEASVPLEVWEQVDDICQGFESLWQGGQRPRLPDYLGQIDNVWRSLLLGHLFKIEVHYCRARGEWPDLERYKQALTAQEVETIQKILLELPTGTGQPSEDGTVNYPDVGSEPPPGVLSDEGRNLPCVPGYEVLDQLGHGGMGIVYRARQQGTEQIVALKLLRQDQLALMDEESRDRAVEQFLTEARAAARLRHPNRVRILHLGEHTGQPYYVMELIEGGNLADKLKQPGGVSKEDAVGYLASVAEAVQEAHQHKIIHRDIKPHNILIDRWTGQALLADFGLAKVEQPLPVHAVTGKESGCCPTVMAGTLPYMSPEQTQDSEHVTKASDVYSLGATLYHLLTGRPPFQGKTKMELIRKICQEKPVPPRKVCRDVSPRIEKICLKCLEKDPGQRYGSALELAQALHHYLQQVRSARFRTTGGKLFMVLSPTAFLTNLAVYLLLQIPFYEPIVWLMVFSMYLPLFVAILLPPKKDHTQEEHLNRLKMFSIWSSHLLAAICISIAFRMIFVTEPEKAVLLVYPVFAPLSAMAIFASAPRMPLWQVALATGLCILPLLMILHLPWAPIIYGLYAMMTAFCYGFFMRRLGMELS